MLPAVWNDVVWALPATTSLPELWAARSISILPFLFLAFDFLLSTCLKDKFASSSHCSFFLMSRLLAQGALMSADRNSHILKIIAPTLLSLQSSRVQWAGCVVWSCVDAVPRIPRALGGSFPDPCLPSFTGQTGNISSPGFSFMWLNNTIYVKAIVSLSHLFPFSFHL